MIKLLIIEDETIQRKNLAAFLRKKKYYVDEANSVEKAIEKIDNNLYSVIISDMDQDSFNDTINYVYSLNQRYEIE